ncbi:hypothetical protein Fmac_020391 [Flemingia macrophylla]|uniref:Uncharacterized protein n=1 Tax=Flemingia macrophylla TaxID=520843 RepID=A0ABD1LTW3_9FABA
MDRNVNVNGLISASLVPCLHHIEEKRSTAGFERILNLMRQNALTHCQMDEMTSLRCIQR